MITTDPTPYAGLRPMGRTGRAGLAAWSNELDTSVVIRHVDLRPGVTFEDLVSELEEWQALGGHGVARPIEAGTENGRPFVARPFVTGQPLSVWSRTDPRPDRSAICTVLAQAGTALASLHRVGLVHGAVAPNNVIVGTGADGRLTAMLTDLRLRVTSDQDLTSDDDVAGLASCGRLVLLGHPLPAELEVALDQALDVDRSSCPTAAALTDAFELAAVEPPAPMPLHEPPVVIISDGSARSTRLSGSVPNPTRLDPSVAIASIDLTELDHLRRTSELRAGSRRRRHRGALVAAVMAFAVAGVTTVWWVARPDPITVEASASLAVARPTVSLDVERLRAIVGPREQVQVILDLAATARRGGSRRCPGDACRLVLVLGRTTAAPPPVPGADPSESVPVDARRLGVDTSPRRGSVTVIAPNPNGFAEPVVDGGPRTTPTALQATTLTPSVRAPIGVATFYVPRGSEVLGAAFVDADGLFLGFSNARGWDVTPG